MRLFKVIKVQMSITECMNEFARLEVGDLGDHLCEQGVRCDVEGDAQKYVGAALIQLTRQAALSHIELKE